jgi:uncharacterized ParB-like nuclease family protein
MPRQEGHDHATHGTLVGDPLNALVVAGNQGLKDPNFRSSLRQMHENKVPLVQIVENLGLDGDMSPQVRQILEDLDPKVVDGIRQAMLEMLDGEDQTMPLACTVTQQQLDAGTSVVVQVVTADNKRTVQATPSTGT